MLDAVYRPPNDTDADSGQTTKVYSIFTFQSLSESDIAAFRYHLYCPACSAQAYYRKASKDGKAACFGSRYHAADCIEFRPSTARKLEEADALAVNEVLANDDEMQIDFSIKPRLSPQPSLGKAASQIQTSSKTYTKTKNKPASTVAEVDMQPANQATSQPSISQDPNGTVAITKQGLPRLLNSLLRGSELQHASLWVYTDEKYRWRAKNLFVNFADAEPTEKGAPRMYWGTLSHADKQMLWLNPAENKLLGIPIDAYQQEFKKRFRVNDANELSGAGIIIFGRCYWNRSKTRKIIQLWNKDVSRMHITKVES
ncbi:hypothetical protein [Shewanella waksmanii]|uniref:hypothetical protein n=1 Tax=Shewanella waksmanii TaxID=213783 RepID=UPI003736A729